ncbi:MAG: FAD-dependent oxidoreductase [Lachnospiraceae bacterium]|nr:FAD-dependent oxidoreductase [Lachnospiraceae bacterium]
MVDTENLYDVIIIGGGPAGLSAALYLTRAKYRVLVLEKEQFGGQITITHEVVNYPGVGKCSGKDLTDTMYKQAEYFGAEFLIAEATGLDLKDDVKIVNTNRGDFKCLSVLLATGAQPKMVGFKGEEEYRGRGVAYCATCDGEFFTGKEVFVVGGGFAAAEESVFLTKFASHVTILIRGEDFSCAKAVAQQAREHEKITVITNTVVEEVRGDNGLNYIRYKNRNTGEITEYHSKEGESFGVFVFVGYAPKTDLVKDIAKLNEQGYVITDKSQKTSVDGLYAAGDICIKPLRQVVTATSDGALAATELEKYVAKVQSRTGIRTKDPKVREKVITAKAENVSHGDNATQSDGLFTREMCAQLETVFERMENSLVLKLYLDDRSVSKKLQEYVKALTSMTDKLSMEIVSDKADEFAPCVKLYKGNSYTGIAFHGVPGGHEFTSFVLGIYNAAGPGQAMDEGIRKRIEGIKPRINIKILVTLSCTMCPDLVVAAYHMAAVGDNVTAEVYDISHYENLRNKYKVMSVPCMVINDEHVYFGKKNMQQLLEIIENHIE